MNSPIYSQNSILKERKEVESPAQTSFLDRITPNRDQVFLFCNLALITAGIAFTFFYNIPILGISLGAYALFYLVMQGRGQNQSTLQNEKEKNIDFNKKIARSEKGTGSKREVSEELGSRVFDLMEQLAKSKDPKKIKFLKQIRRELGLDAKRS